MQNLRSQRKHNLYRHLCLFLHAPSYVPCALLCTKLHRVSSSLRPFVFSPSPILPFSHSPCPRIFVFLLLSFVLKFQFPPPFSVFSFYKLVSCFEICDPHIWPIPFVINISPGERISFHCTINRVISVYLLTNIETS